MHPDIHKEVRALEHLSTTELCERYATLFGEQTRTRHKTYLIRKIAWRLQARLQGDLSECARRRAEELADDAEVRVMPPKDLDAEVCGSVKVIAAPTDARLPAPGTAIVRTYKGHKIQVLVLADGFEYQGERYKSLSAVAKVITGTHCNGFRFFNLEGEK